MSRFLLVPAGTQTALTDVALGLVSAWTQTGNNALYFKPVSDQDQQTDPAFALVQTLWPQSQPQPQPVTLAQFDQALSHDQADDVMDRIVTDFHQLISQPHDAVVIEGVTSDPDRPYLFEQNARIATSLNAEVILVVAVGEQSAATIAGKLQLFSQPYAHSQTRIAGFILNQCPADLDSHDYVDQLKQQLSQQGLHVPCVGVVLAQTSTEQQANATTRIQALAEYFDVAWLNDHAGTVVSERLSPAAFRYQMMQRARQANKRIVLPEGSEPRTVAAAAMCQRKGIARCVLLAKTDEVQEVAARQGIVLPDDLEIIDPDSIREEYVAPMVALRQHKGLTPEQADKQLADTVVLGTMMLAQGDVDGLVSGAVHTTANTIRPALQLIKTAPGASLVSSVFFMLMPEQVLVYGDCAVNPEPSAAELADIAIQSADSAKAFGIEPKVAMISYSTGTSGSGAAVEKVKEATALAKAKRPDLPIDGPLQYDAASVPDVARQKAPDSPVAGQATVFVFPDLNTGNTTYKAVQRSAHVLSVGPMLQGLNKPVNDLSRGALVEDIVYTIALTAIQATQMSS
ncbi:phosphate acetyltransferase [Neisseriaceae bacterium ESL0693]|nr:phosphate acetyltransferase [Neisseriaceae bacterium ESL0693]